MVSSPRGIENPYSLQVRSWSLDNGHYATFLQFDLKDIGLVPDDIKLIELEVFMTDLEFGVSDEDSNGDMPPYNLAVRGFPLPREHEEFDNTAWSEDTLTWDTAPNVLWNNIAPPGESYTWDLLHFFDYHGDAIDYVLVGQSTDTIDELKARYVGTWFTLDVTDYVRDALERGDEYVTLLLFEGPTEGSHRSSTMTFASKEHDSGNGPMLYIISIPETTTLTPRDGLADAIAYVQALNPAGFDAFTWFDMYDELRRALLAYNNENATELQLKNAESRLRDRIAALIVVTPAPVVDRTALIAAIEDGESREMHNYFVFSWFDLQDELARARRVRDNPHATQAQVDTAAGRLEAIITALIVN